MIDNPIDILVIEDDELVARTIAAVRKVLRDAKTDKREVHGVVMVGGVVGKVAESKNPNFQAGDYVEGYFGWQEYAVTNGEGVRKLDPALAPISTALGLLGMPGMTAYFGFLELCQPKAGDTTVVSGAAGAVGWSAARVESLSIICTTGSTPPTKTPPIPTT